LKAFAGGNGNTVGYRTGPKPKQWFGGDGNRIFIQQTSKEQPAQKPAKKPIQVTKTKPLSNAGQAALPSQFHNIWFIYNQNSGARWPAMTLTDGTITTAVNDTMELGVAASRKKNNNRWGTYTTTKSGEQLVVKFPKWKKAGKYFITDRSIKMSNNFALKGCYSATSSSELGMTGVICSKEPSSSTFCFESNGRFSNDSSLAISGTSSNSRSLGSSVSGKHGTYKINGNAITLNYANGKSVKTVFGAYRFGEPSPNLVGISIGQRMLFD